MHLVRAMIHYIQVRTAVDYINVKSEKQKKKLVLKFSIKKILTFFKGLGLKIKKKNQQSSWNYS